MILLGEFWSVIFLWPVDTVNSSYLIWQPLWKGKQEWWLLWDMAAAAAGAGSSHWKVLPAYMGLLWLLRIDSSAVNCGCGNPGMELGGAIWIGRQIKEWGLGKHVSLMGKCSSCSATDTSVLFVKWVSFSTGADGGFCMPLSAARLSLRLGLLEISSCILQVVYWIVESPELFLKKQNISSHEGCGDWFPLGRE